MNRVLAEKGNFEMPIITADDTGHHQPSCSASLIGDVPCRHESLLENAAQIAHLKTQWADASPS